MLAINLFLLKTTQGKNISPMVLMKEKGAIKT